MIDRGRERKREREMGREIEIDREMEIRRDMHPYANTFTLSNEYNFFTIYVFVNELYPGLNIILEGKFSASGSEVIESTSYVDP